MQALVVSYEGSVMAQLSLFQYRQEFDALLPADALDDHDATKENVIERVTKGSASLVHFLVHGIAGGKGAASIEFVILCSHIVCVCF